MAGGRTMDVNRFDTMSKMLSTDSTRRGLLRIVAATPLAGMLTALQPEQSRGRKHRCKRCKTIADCSTKRNQICDNGCCHSCSVCSGGECSHNSVQEAIDAARRGAIIRICP